MNLFMPYNGIEESVRVLDDVRLNKQILECRQIHEVALDPQKKAYAKHPIVVHYVQFPRFVARYGYECCLEYKKRRGRDHAYLAYFNYHRRGTSVPEGTNFQVFCAEGSKNSPDCIRTYDPIEVNRLYKNKLINKWSSDVSKGRPPKWTNVEVPEFWEDHLRMEDDLK